MVTIASAHYRYTGRPSLCWRPRVPGSSPHRRVRRLRVQNSVYSTTSASANRHSVGGECGSMTTIAIVGMACRIPGGSSSPEDLWRLLLNRTDTVGEIPASRWDVGSYFHPEPGRPGKMYTRHGSFLDGIDQFDADFFGISPREAACMDPQQRLLLELAWEAFEDAGIRPSRVGGSDASVFVGLATNDYGELARSVPMSIAPYTATGSALSIAANRVSHHFDLRGPSMAIDTACSSALVAVHLACQSLARGESPVALVGGANLILDP